MSDLADQSILQNADAAAEALAKQAKDGLDSLRPDVSPQREADLDSAFLEAQKKTPPEIKRGEPGHDANGRPLPGKPEKAPDEVVDPAPTSEPAPKAEPEPKKDPVPEPEPSKGLLGDLLAEPAKKEPAAAPKTDDPFGNVKLRADASEKTKSSFEEVKRIAREREQAALTKYEETRKQFEELQGKVAELEKKQLPDDVAKELQELRSFRAQFDTEHDPEFRAKYDTRTDSNYEAIYGKLASHGLPEAEIAKLRQFAPRDRDSAIENFLGKLPSFDRKFIEAKLLDNVNVADERDRALQDARKNADKLLAERKQQPVVETAKRDAAVAEILRPALPKLNWIHVREVPSTATPEEKKRIEAENQFAVSMQEELKRAIVDDSPKTRAEAALAVPLAHFLRRELQTVSQQRDELQKQLDAIKAAGAISRTSRANGNAATPPPRPPEKPKETGDALDDLFAEAQQRR